MYSIFISGEVKKWLRDPMTRFMLFYPLLFIVVGRYILPVIASESGFSLEANADYILAALTLMTPLLFGAIIGFSILDDRDDHILVSIRVTPLSVSYFMLFRLIMVYLFSFAASILVITLSNVGSMGLKDALLVSFLASLSAPVTGLLINLFANNKIEGFAIMKLVGLLIILPVVALIFHDARELFFAPIPAYWPAKIIAASVRGEESIYLNYNFYFWGGLLYAALLNLVAYRSLSKKLAA